MVRSRPRILFWLVRILWVMLAYAAVTQYTFNPFTKHIGSITYDETASSLLRGEISVGNHPESEPFVVNGKQVSYYGPFPALLRIPLNLAFPALFALWAPLSAFAAALLIVVLVASTFERSLQSAGYPESRLAVALFELGIAVATPLFFLYSTPWQYHEAMLWGLVGSAITIRSVVADPKLERGVTPILLAVAFGVALTSRPTFAVSTGVPLLACGAARIRKGVSRADLLGAMIVIGVLVFQGWVNWTKFGDPRIFQDNRTYGGYLRLPDLLETIEAQGEFNVRRLPTTLRVYLIPSSRNFSLSWPHLRMLYTTAPSREWFPTGSAPVAPLSLSASWLILLALTAIMSVLHGVSREPVRRDHGAGLVPVIGRNSWKVITWCHGALAGAFFQALLIFTYFAMSNRYLGDTLPILFLLAHRALNEPVLFGPETARRRAPWMIAVVGALIVFSFAYNFLATLEWIGTYSWDPAPTLKKWLSTVHGMHPK